MSLGFAVSRHSGDRLAVFLVERLLYQKTYFVKVVVESFPRLQRPFSNSLMAIFDFSVTRIQHRSVLIKTYFPKVVFSTQKRWTPFQTSAAVSEPPGGHIGFCMLCKRCSVAEIPAQQLKSAKSSNLHRAHICSPEPKNGIQHPYPPPVQGS